ncbi:shikimate dehydrogenase [Psittacicella melopsittaci]|uniref:shikimate dehydrogenase (NADP(+)) n=1 Tax=Psittacicella melopsittaci TaxID=2028576 RepID=A0A3A1Y392_9GAMM|nr:shikimate dehydrogenase [Psittacicella melopsittaci]RIY31911.1 shikimate dehydrogenase [Psittacicella melopsittaci]
MLSDRYLVWGNPIAHSLSPRIHEIFANQRGERIDYRRRGEGMDVATFISSFLNFFNNEGGKGSNITSPFKQVVYELIENRSEVCEIAQACNTVIKRADGSLFAENTDGYGLSTDLKDLGWLGMNTRVLILGAGGAVTGVLFHLLQEGAVVDIFNRTRARAQEVAKAFSKFGQVNAVNEYDFNEYDLVINAVAYKQGDAGVNLRTTRVTNAYTKFYDMQYTATGKTPFLAFVSDLGVENNIANGLGMLVKQAALSHYYWFGVLPDAKAALEQLRQELAEAASGC